jgi:hypothetical protein
LDYRRLASKTNSKKKKKKPIENKNRSRFQRFFKRQDGVKAV